MTKQLFTLPNLLTAINLACGLLAIITVITTDNASLVATFIAISLICDFFDGFVARALKINSDIGKELDSLADVITFGAFPAVLMIRLIGESTGTHFDWSFDSVVPFTGFVPYLGLLIAVFSALRLAKFNLDERQSDCFYGLATPANTIFILSLWLVKVYQPDSFLLFVTQNPWILLGLTVILSYLLISELKLIAFKFKNFSWNDNKYKFSIIILSIILIAIFQIQALPLTILLYIGISILQNILTR